MVAEIIKVVDAVSEAKDVDREVIFEAIENALESATKKKYTDNMDVKVDIDRETGDYKTYRQWMVFADDSRELEDPDLELRMIDAVDVDKDANPGEFVREEIESVDFGRIGAQIAKQVIVQKNPNIAQRYLNPMGSEKPSYNFKNLKISGRISSSPSLYTKMSSSWTVFKRCRKAVCPKIMGCFVIGHDTYFG